MLEIYIKNIADKRQTCEIFKKFILLTLSNYQIDLPEPNEEQDLLGQVSRLRKREEQIPPLEWVNPLGPGVR
jgi:hypothetical protein